jgi:hypothetical protein
MGEEASNEELEHLQQWVEENNGNRQFFEKLNNADFLSMEYRDYKNVDREAAWKKLSTAIL